MVEIELFTENDVKFLIGIGSASKHHQNNNLKVIITFSNFIRSSFYDINKTEQILEFYQKVKR